MNSDYDITFSSSESASSGSARNRFIDSLGVGEASITDEGLVLSSQPDLDGSEASVDLSKGRAISISVNRGAAAHRSVEIKIPASSAAEKSASLPSATAASADTVEAQATSASAETAPAGIGEGDLEAIISLSCPECAGELVIKRRHLGVEGACVWCHAPIVAAETARDRQIRVFPILGGIQKAEPVDNRIAEVPIEATPDAAPAPWRGLDPATDTNLPETPNGTREEPSEPAWGGNQGFSPSFETAVPTGGLDEEQEEEERPIPVEHSAPMNLEDLYASTGFGEPAREAGAEPGFGESLADPSIGATSFSPAGFGAFLQSPASPAESDIDFPPSPRSADIAPSGFGPAFPAPVTSGHEEPAPMEPTGFGTPAPWGPPTKSSPAEAVVDAPPALIHEESALADWASAFENHVEPVHSTVSLSDEISQETLSSHGGFSGFEPSSELNSAESQPAPSPETSSEGTPGFFFSDAPASHVLFGRGESSGESPAMPGHCFSTGSSIEAQPESFDALFPSSPVQEIHTPVFEAIDAHPPDEAPATRAHSGGDAPFPSVDRGPSLFGESPFVSSREEPTNEPSAPSFQGSAVSELQAAPNPVFVGPEISPTPTQTGSAAPVSPGIPPLPALAKPKPKVRKGFVVLMVIIVGFASGAALASFVLPVEEYVETARAFMESKFNPAGVTQQLPPLPFSPGSESPIETTKP